MRAPLGGAAGIESHDAIGFPQLLDHLSHQDFDQRPVVPGRGANEVLHDQALDLNQRRDVLGIFAWQVSQQPLDVEMHIALTGLGLESMLIGHDAIAQTVHHVSEDVRGNDAITQQFLLTLCPRRCHLFASSQGHINTGCGWEAIDTTRGYVTQQRGIQ